MRLSSSNSVIGALLVCVSLQALGVAISTKRDQISNSSCNRMLQTRSIEPFSTFDKTTATVMRYRKQQSVNMGSWFVHEDWLTPSVFKEAAGPKVSELDIASGSDSTDCARMVLETHWETFITESDFFYLSSIGINTVRIPIGYWSLGPEFCVDTPFSAVADVYRNSWSYIVRAINMAAAAGIGVLIDLHGAVGSQNGQPHSGISDGHIGLFNNATNIKKTLTVLSFLAEELCNVTNIVGVEVLNEPVDCPELIGFYNSAISTMRSVPGAETFPLYIHDGFNLGKFSDFIANRTDFIVQDSHSYFVFTAQDEKKSASQHTKEIQTTVSDSLAMASANQRGNLVIDEWSCALTPTSLSAESDQIAARHDFCNVQLQVYWNTTAGWSFWTYTKEDCDNDPAWCFTAAVGNILPSDFSSSTQSCSRYSAGLIDIRSDIASNSALSSRDPFAAIRYRRWRRDAETMTSEQRSSSQGYSDGLFAAHFFCAHGSRLGFTGQYIQDSIEALGPHVVSPGTESYYSASFMRGLADGE
ncbi:glycoside hydrolase [Mycena polygramma]|nr:glycoside hydrolase [Mycena polygramma]